MQYKLLLKVCLIGFLTGNSLTTWDFDLKLIFILKSDSERARFIA